MQVKDGSLWITIKVITKSSRHQVGEWSNDQVLKVYTNQAPEKGKANDAVLRLLADTWGISLHQITLVRGSTSSRKIIRLEGITNLPHTPSPL